MAIKIGESRKLANDEVVVCRGRNGFFQLDEVFVYITGKADPKVGIEFFSSKKGRSAPMLMKGKAQDIYNLLEELQTQIIAQRITE